MSRDRDCAVCGGWCHWDFREVTGAVTDAWKMEGRDDWNLQGDDWDLQREGGPVSDAGGVDPDDDGRSDGQAYTPGWDDVVRQLPTPASQSDGSVLALAEVCDVRGLPDGDDEAGGAPPAPDTCKSCGFPSPTAYISFPPDEIIEHDGGRSYSYRDARELVCDPCLRMLSDA